MRKALGAYVFAGGFTVGVKRHFDVVAHLEGTPPYGARTVRANWPEMPIYPGPDKWPVGEFDRLVRGDDPIEFVYCNPPCAVFSSMGIVTTRGKDSWRTDPRTQCWHDSFGLLAKIRPRALVIESVCQAYTRGREMIDDMTRSALTMGYSVTHLMHDAKWMGLPQSRRRFFFVAHRASALVGLQHNWAPPPTIGEVLAEVPDPGHYTRHKRADWITLIENTPPGGRLCHTYERLNPGCLEVLNAQGNVKGRPSFQERRLDANETMGAWTGDKFFHPTETRAIGLEECKAICGFPPEFVVAPEDLSGFGSLLARGVMPPVGEWIARVVDQTLEQADVNERDALRVTFIDLREPNRPNVDLTRDYLNERGRVVVRVRAAMRPVDDGDEPEPPAEPEPVLRVPEPRYPTPQVHTPRATTDVVRVNLTIPTKTERLAEARVDDNTAKLDGEGSGRYIQRLWMTGRWSHEEILALVHLNYPGRKTKKSDVYYNYRALISAGTPDVPPWTDQPRARGRQSSSIMATIDTGEIVVKPLLEVGTTLKPHYGKPRALLTGSTAMQVGSDKTQLKIITSMRGWRNALEDLGYDVDWRQVTPGEDLADYAVVMVGIQSPGSVVSSSFFGALWTLTVRPDAIGVFDDWQVSLAIRNIDYVAKRGEEALESGHHFDEHVRLHQTQLFSTLKRLASEKWWFPVVIPMFNGGDLSKISLYDRCDVVPLDPTNFIQGYPVEVENKTRQWVQASLLNKPLPVELTWPIDAYGNLFRESKKKITGENAQPRLVESELMKVYARSWGVLSPAHEHAGSGWWRVRYLMAADAGCVLLADPREAAVMGDPYTLVSDNPRIVERMTDDQLTELASSQAVRLRSTASPREKVLDSLRYLFHNKTKEIRPSAIIIKNDDPIFEMPPGVPDAPDPEALNRAEERVMAYLASPAVIPNPLPKPTSGTAIVDWFPRICGATDYCGHLQRAAPDDTELVSFSKRGGADRWTSWFPWRSYKAANAADILNDYDNVILGDVACFSPNVWKTKDERPFYLEIMERVRTRFTAIFHGGTYPIKHDPTMDAIFSAPGFTGSIVTPRKWQAAERLSKWPQLRIVHRPYLPYSTELRQNFTAPTRERSILMTARIATNKGQNALLKLLPELNGNVNIWGYNAFGFPSIMWRLWEFGNALGYTPDGPPALRADSASLTHPNAPKFYTGKLAFTAPNGRRFNYHDAYGQLSDVNWAPWIFTSLPSRDFAGIIEYTPIDAIHQGCVVVVPENCITESVYETLVTVPYEGCTSWYNIDTQKFTGEERFNHEVLVNKLNDLLSLDESELENLAAAQRAEAEELHDPAVAWSGIIEALNGGGA